MSYLLLPWLDKTTVRRPPGKELKTACFFRKNYRLTKDVTAMNRRNQSVFQAAFRLQLSNFHRRKVLLLPASPNSHTQSVFLQVPSSVKVHLRHTGPIRKNTCFHSVLWVMSAIRLTILVRWDCSVRWPPNQELQATCFFQKTQGSYSGSCWTEWKTTTTTKMVIK